jgi:CRP-like cAMP-binding protein
MSKGTYTGVAEDGDILESLHGQGKQRDQEVPQFDVAQTLRLVRAVRHLAALDAEAANFWAALTPTEQADLVVAAKKRTFPAGTALMGEGERADSVMVILDGRTRVCIREEGREWVIAERGPGDIVGEGGTAPGGVRSATVVAIEPVLALVMTTEDFAVFESEHPDLPDVVKQQVYDRVTGLPDPPGEKPRRPT